MYVRFEKHSSSFGTSGVHQKSTRVSVCIFNNDNDANNNDSLKYIQQTMESIFSYSNVTLC